MSREIARKREGIPEMGKNIRDRGTERLRRSGRNPFTPEDTECREYVVPPGARGLTRRLPSAETLGFLLPSREAGLDCTNWELNSVRARVLY